MHENIIKQVEKIASEHSMTFDEVLILICQEIYEMSVMKDKRAGVEI